MNRRTCLHATAIGLVNLRLLELGTMGGVPVDVA
jgi:hypothetical protein